jgi:hypothetical protein
MKNRTALLTVSVVTAILYLSLRRELAAAWRWLFG